MIDEDPVPKIEQMPPFHKGGDEYHLIRSLIELGRNETGISLPFERCKLYDFHRDGKLTPDELYLIPATLAMDELGHVIEHSLQEDAFVASVLSYLPDSKIARAFLGASISDRKTRTFEIIAQENPERAARILLGMRENPYDENPYSSEGFRVYRMIKGLPDKLRESILQYLSAISPQYAKNIRRQALDEKILIPNKADYPWSSDPVEASIQGELPQYPGVIEAKKVGSGLDTV